MRERKAMSEALLEGILVVDLCQFLSGPYASLRLMDLGARVIKIERPDGGDLSRRLYLSDTEIGGDSTIFHAINRSKESLALDLKKPADVESLKRLLRKADVVLQNFRPGVIERLLERHADCPPLLGAGVGGHGLHVRVEVRAVVLVICEHDVLRLAQIN